MLLHLVSISSVYLGKGRDHHIHLALLRDPASMYLPLSLGVRKLRIKVTVKLHHKLAHLHHCDILPDTGVRSSSELDGRKYQNQSV